MSHILYYQLPSIMNNIFKHDSKRYYNICPICLEPLNNNIIKIWSCNHYFHSKCIINWNKFCPYCRCNTIINDDKYYIISTSVAIFISVLIFTIIIIYN